MTATWRSSASGPLRRTLVYELTQLLANVDKTVDIAPTPSDVAQIQQPATYAATSEKKKLNALHGFLGKDVGMVR